jgi:lipoyl(octanoyl) transferase
MIVRNLGKTDYIETWQAMQQFAQNRKPQDADEIWFTEHPSVYTQGQAGADKHLLTTTDIPVIRTDRGGQITYHGLGQLLVYPLIDIRKTKITPRSLVSTLENLAMATLRDFGIQTITKPKAPGVYTLQGAKIAFIGLRFKNMCSYHGLSLNVDMNLAPFANINPCGYEKLAITDMATEINDVNITNVKQSLINNAKTLL